MITAPQIRAARALLGWTQQTLADKACVALTALKRLESRKDSGTHENTQDRVHRALRAAGIEFIWGSKGVGVLLREIEEKEKTSK
ncbi:helix-turn-helix domain-containing protein [Rhodobacteraceae bacterium 2376]|uniref:Helix-turn-helix domain-containing protein n=1 Tax=Rhabdonatronobacter sediminivivens TaxID=2743469 RepID=A0A7Z0KZQ5_9RHOB|nr:helix-turn-helix domain-containing protein [Rhabdonatronobacter sediminivivens]NYS26674.1 helix-turn-helix domain-containing protein [Rhabdonatronobacter sediminivivens]